MATTTANLTSSTAGNPNAAPYSSASLYVGDLNNEVTEAVLFDVFNAVGPVASVRVCRDATTRRSLGYAYVNFHRLDDAERALDTLNYKAIRNRPCRIMWSHRDPSLRRSGLGNIFVNHLAKTIDHKQLYDTFSVFGNILSCKVAQNSKGDSLGYGFVHYEADESAARAIDKVDGKNLAGEKVSVSAFKSKKERGGTNKYKYTNVFVKNLNADVTKEQLDGLFAKFGTISSSMLTADRDNKQRSFGFINFQAPEEASAAVEGLNDTEFQGRKLYVARAQKKDEREKELRERFEQLKQERQKKYAGVNLYVKNLSDDMDDEKLTQEFAKYGNISSAKIMKDGTKSRGFGFVCFASTEEATKAVTAMNGFMVDGKPLYVALAQRKDVRRAQLEAQYSQRQKMGPVGIPGGVGNMAQGMPHQMGAYPGAGVGGPMGNQGGPMMFRSPQNYMGYPGIAPRWGVGGMQQPNPQMLAGVRGPHPAMNYQLMPLNQRGGVPMQGQQLNLQGQQGPRQNNNLQGHPNAQRGPRQNNNNNGPRGPGQAGQAGQVMGGQLKQGQHPFPQGQQGQAGIGGVPQQQGQQQQGQQLRYADNVRNQRGANPNQMMMGQMPNQQQGGAPGVTGQAEQVVMPAPNEPLTIKALAAAPEDMRKQMIGERLFPLIKLQEPALAGKITGMLLEMDNGELIHLLESQSALQEKIQEALNVLNQHPGHNEETQEEETK